MEMSQSLPGLSLSTRAKQQIDASLTVTTDNTDMPITQPPFDLNFVLKSLKIDLYANDEDVAFDSDQMSESLYLNQVSKMIDRPIQMHFGDRFDLQSESEDLRQIIKELPVLQEVDLKSMLVELFLHFFALGGKELTVGQTYQRDLGDHSIPTLPNVVNYTITAIDDYNIHASISGNIEKRKLKLKGLVQVNDKELANVEVSLSGTMNGKVKWNRDNAMLYDLEMEYAYSAMFKLAEWDWMMNVTLHLHNRTKMKGERGKRE